MSNIKFYCSECHSIILTTNSILRSVSATFKQTVVDKAMTSSEVHKTSSEVHKTSSEVHKTRLSSKYFLCQRNGVTVCRSRFLQVKNSELKDHDITLHTIIICTSHILSKKKRFCVM